MDGVSVLKTLMLSSLALDSVHLTVVAFVPTPPPIAVADSAVPTTPARLGNKLRRIQSTPRIPCRWCQPPRHRVLDTPQQCLSSSAASSDAAREDEPWQSVECAASGESGERAYYRSRSQGNSEYRGLVSPGASARVVGVDSGGGSDAFVFEPNPLPQGRSLRRLKPADIDGVVALAFEEYYDGAADIAQATALEVWGDTWEQGTLNGSFDQSDVDQLTDWFEMVWLRTMIRWGFGLRANIGKGGRDHRVFCVSDEEGEERAGARGSVVAVAEVSLQVPNGRTAPPIPLPLWFKRLIAWPGPVLPYISNVLVDETMRRQGLAKRLMLQCEDQAREWGYTQVYLHVDMAYWPAVRMYESLGYEGVSMLEMGFQSPRLRYMKKVL